MYILLDSNPRRATKENHHHLDLQWETIKCESGPSLKWMLPRAQQLLHKTPMEHLLQWLPLNWGMPGWLMKLGLCDMSYPEKMCLYGRHRNKITGASHLLGLRQEMKRCNNRPCTCSNSISTPPLELEAIFLLTLGIRTPAELNIGTCTSARSPLQNNCRILFGLGIGVVPSSSIVPKLIWREMCCWFHWLAASCAHPSLLIKCSSPTKPSPSWPIAFSLGHPSMPTVWQLAEESFSLDLCPLL